jgi:CheY-like chemotaxis protein
MKGDDEKARAAGCDGFVTKPIQVREFAATVAAFLKGAKSGSSPHE